MRPGATDSRPRLRAGAALLLLVGASGCILFRPKPPGGTELDLVRWITAYSVQIRATFGSSVQALSNSGPPAQPPLISLREVEASLGKLSPTDRACALCQMFTSTCGCGSPMVTDCPKMRQLTAMDFAVSAYALRGQTVDPVHPPPEVAKELPLPGGVTCGEAQDSNCQACPSKPGPG